MGIDNVSLKSAQSYGNTVQQVKNGLSQANGQTGNEKPLDRSAYIISASDNSDRAIEQAVETANKKLKASQSKCEFGYDERTKTITIKILDSETDEIIRELPPEKTLEMIAKLWEIAGILVDEKR